MWPSKASCRPPDIPAVYAMLELNEIRMAKDCWFVVYALSPNGQMPGQDPKKGKATNGIQGLSGVYEPMHTHTHTQKKNTDNSTHVARKRSHSTQSHTGIGTRHSRRKLCRCSSRPLRRRRHQHQRLVGPRARTPHAHCRNSGMLLGTQPVCQRQHKQCDRDRCYYIIQVHDVTANDGLDRCSAVSTQCPVAAARGVLHWIPALDAHRACTCRHAHKA